MEPTRRFRHCCSAARCSANSIIRDANWNSIAKRRPGNGIRTALSRSSPRPRRPTRLISLAEPETLHDRYGQTINGMGPLLARRLAASPPPDIAKTVYHTMGIHDLSATDSQNRPDSLQEEGRPLLQLL